MKLRVDRDILAEAVTWTARSVPARPPVPVLAGVRLEAKGSSLVLASFDYEVSAHCEVAADEFASSRKILYLVALSPVIQRPR